MSTSTLDAANPARDRQVKPLAATIGGYALLLFVLSSLRHALFQSGALDLGYHDQILYLLSQGEPPIVSFWGYHFLGGHAEWIYYGLAWLYRLYADVHWLLAIQAVALAITIWPILELADHAGLNRHQGWTVAIAYLLYPLVFNVNLFDFHPEVIALPLILMAVLTARRRQPVGFVVAATLILGCRASLSLLLVFMGLWLLTFERRRWYGVYALLIGSAWFLFFSRVLVPHFKPDGYHALSRYGNLGDSISEVMVNVFLQPGTALQQLFTLANLEYIALLLIPVLWGLSWQHLAPLMACLPILGMNLLSESLAQKNLIFQYSLPILPFLILSVISSLAAKECLLKKRRWIVLWCLICFAALGKYTHFTGLYLSSLDTWTATRQAISQIDTQEPVLTTHSILPHLIHRKVGHFITEASRNADLNQYGFVLLDLQNPGYQSSPELAQWLLSQLNENVGFEQVYSRDEVYLFRRNF